MTTINAAAAISGDPAASAAASVTPAVAGDTGAAAIAEAAASAAPAPAPTSDQWWGKLENQDVRTWAEAKGFKDPLTAVESAYNLEKLLGFDKAGRTLVMPGENATPEEIKAFNAKLGVPETADGYKLPVPDGVDESFAKTAAQWFHENGVPAKAAEQIASKWNETMAAQQKAADDAFAVQSENEFKTWQAEQGAAATQNIELAKRAASQFIPAADTAERQAIMEKMERAMGTGAFMKMMSSIGSGLSEHKVHTGGAGGLTPTPAQAQQRINELRSNTEWAKAYVAGDKAKLSEMEGLMKLAYPEVNNG